MLLTPAPAPAAGNHRRRPARLPLLLASLLPAALAAAEAAAAGNADAASASLLAFLPGMLIAGLCLLVALGERRTARRLQRELDTPRFQIPAAEPQADSDATLRPAAQQNDVAGNYRSLAMNPRELERELRAALNQDQLRLVYQPRLNLRTRQFTAVEAVVHWEHPQRGRLPAEAFLPLAGDCGLSRPLYAWLLRRAFADTLQRRQQGLDLRLAVNLSPGHGLQPDLADLVIQIAAEAGFDLRALELGVDASVLRAPDSAAADALRRLAARGAGIALNDAGVMAVPLAACKTFGIRQIRLNPAWVADLVESPAAAGAVNAAVNLGHGLGLTVLADGVTSAAQLRHLRASGCDLAQGEQVGEPLADQSLLRLHAMMQDWRRAA